MTSAKKRHKKPVEIGQTNHVVAFAPSSNFFPRASCHSDKKSVKKRHVTKTCEHKGEKAGFIACFVHQFNFWKKENPKEKPKDHSRRFLKERKFLKG